MPLLSLAILSNRTHPSLRNRIRALHLNRRLHERRPFAITITKA